MGYGVMIGRVSDTRLVSVYCSNTASAALVKGKVAALRYTDTVTPSTPEENGTRFGAAVDYPSATNSVVVGVLWGGTRGVTTWANASWGECVTRGPLALVYASGTVAAKVALYPSSLAANCGYVDDITGDGTAPHGYVGYSVGSVATAVTGSIAVFVNTLFA